MHEKNHALVAYGRSKRLTELSRYLGATALQCISANALVDRIGLVLAPHRKPYHRMLRNVVDVEPRELHSAVSRPGQRGALVDQMAHRLPGALGISKFMQGLSKGLRFRHQRGWVSTS